MVAPRHLLVLALTSLGLSGCVTTLQDLNYKLVNKSRAEYAWYSGTSMSDRWNCGSDYAHGYKSGYFDASTGRGCVLPAVPPPCYWSTKYQCCEGQEQIQDWYRGYQCGVAAAQGSGYPSFHTIPKGPQAPVVNKDGCGMCYSPTGCQCENSPPPPPPIIEHISSVDAQPQAISPVAEQPTAPIYQVSATSGQMPALGLIGPAGMSALSAGAVSAGTERPSARTARIAMPQPAAAAQVTTR